MVLITKKNWGGWWWITDGDKWDVIVSWSWAVRTIDNDVVTNAKLANMATQTFKGRIAAGTWDPQDLTIAQAKTMLNLAGTNSGDQTLASLPIDTNLEMWEYGINSTTVAYGISSSGDRYTHTLNADEEDLLVQAMSLIIDPRAPWGQVLGGVEPLPTIDWINWVHLYINCINYPFVLVNQSLWSGFRFVNPNAADITLNPWEGIHYIYKEDTWWVCIGRSGWDVVWPASATDEAIARFDTTTWKLLKDSTVKITNNWSIIMPENNNPTPSASGEMKLFTRSISDRLLPAFIWPSGLDSTLQPLLARNKVWYWCPPWNATTVPWVLWFTAPTFTSFTGTIRSVTTTNLFTRMRRLGYVTPAPAWQVWNWRQSVAQYTVWDSTTGLWWFHYVIRFGISDASAVSDARMFMWFRNVVTPSNVEPSTLTNCIWIWHGASDTNMKLFYWGSSAQTPIDLWVNFPSNTRNVDVYELSLFSAPNSWDVHREVTRLNTGHVAKWTITNSWATVLPTNTTLIWPRWYRTNNATALAVAIDIMSAYIETDF